MKEINRRERIKKFLLSRSLIGSIILSVSLWLYASLNAEYITFVQVPLELAFPANRAIEKSPPEKISVKVRGNGWNLFNLMFFNSAAKSHIDLSHIKIDEDTYKITRNDILEGVLFFNNVEALDVLPETLTIKAGLIGRYKVPAISVVNIQPKEGFTIVGVLKIKPDSIFIEGNDFIVRKIKSWKTKNYDFEGLYENAVLTAELSDSLAGLVKLSTQYITISVEIQQIAETVVDNIPILIQGGNLPSNHRLLPESISVTLRGGIDEIADFSIDLITAIIDYRDIISDTTGLLKPEIIIPGNIKVIQTNPPYIYHFVREQGDKLAKY
ncbi:MAG: hypothetical protein QG635_2149 [Bacteroidota bacterium]|nr:hypothetical protein [Bacteroidota bacterium]